MSIGILKKLQRRFMLTCEDVNHFLVEYLEGALEERTQVRFEKHVSACPVCTAYLEQYRTTIALVNEEGRLASVRPPEELYEMTLAFLREHLEEGPS